MIRLAGLLIVLAGPALADMQMTRAQCTQSWLRAVELVFAPSPDVPMTEAAIEKIRILEQVRVATTPDGWCQILPQNEPALHTADLEEIKWRAEGLDVFIASDSLPSQFALSLTGVVHDSPAQLNLVMQHIPDDGVVLIERLELSTSDRATITATALIDGAHFRDIGTAMLSLGGLSLKRMAVTADVTPKMIAELVPDLDADFLKGSVVLLNFRQLDRADRTALFAFADDLPTATGVLTLDYVSERGLSIAQLVIAQFKEPAEAANSALSDAIVHVDWRPGG
jgi:hypothetical protein